MPARAALLLALLLLAGAARGQTLTRPPALAEPPAPLRLGDGGRVLLELELDAEGALRAASVVESGGPALDELALVRVRAFRFTPAEVDGRPAPVRVRFEVLVEAEARDAGPPAVLTAALEGVLTAAGTREPVAGALVTAGGETVTSDEAGRFAFPALPPGPTAVLASAAGFAAFEATEALVAGEKTVVRYALLPGGARRETVVRAERDRREVSQVRLEGAALGKVAGTGGDAFKVLQSLPSVARTSLGSSALVVRGSKSWDSRVYVDEVQVPQLFHFGGLTATFDAAQVERLAFQPGNFGAGFGRSIGGLVLADTRAPSRQGYHGFVDLGLLDASALVEGPLAGDWAFTASGRRGLTDLLLPWALSGAAVGFALAPVSWDYQLKVERGRAGKDRLFVALHGSSDAWQFLAPNFFLDTGQEGNQGSAGSAVQYHRLVLGFERRLAEGLTLVSRTSVGLDRTEQLGGATNIFYRNTQVPVQLKDRLEWELPALHLSLSAGLDLALTPTVLDAQAPPPFKPNVVPDPYVDRHLQAEQSTTVYVEPALFLEGRWQPWPELTLVAGLRGDWMSVMGQGWVDPRGTVLYAPLEWLTLKAGVGLFHQPPDYRNGQLSPVFGNPALKPEGALHSTLGVEGRFLGELLSVDVEGWHKWLFDQARQVLTGGLGSDLNIPGAESRFASTGWGRAWGLDVLLKAKVGDRFFGWVAYTLSRVEREALVGAGTSLSPLDQPHNLVVVASAELPWGLTFGVRFRFASGALVTPVIASLYDNNGNYFYPLPGVPWSERLPSFFQLDARLDKRFVFAAWSLAVYADVQNATNQQNPEGLFYSFDYRQKAYVYGIPILPSVGVKGAW